MLLSASAWHLSFSTCMFERDFFFFFLRKFIEGREFCFGQSFRFIKLMYLKYFQVVHACLKVYVKSKLNLKNIYIFQFYLDLVLSKKLCLRKLKRFFGVWLIQKFSDEDNHKPTANTLWRLSITFDNDYRRLTTFSNLQRWLWATFDNL